MNADGIAMPDIKPAFAERNVPVVLATDENYLPYVKVAVNSVIEQSAECNLDIIILHSGVSDGAIQVVSANYAGFANVSVRFVDVAKRVSSSVLADFKHVDRLPVSACFRLLLPDVLSAYDKVIYLDVDVAACRNLGDLYATDISDCYFAAAKDVVHLTKPEYLSWAAGWGFTEWDGYVNTGVLVMNLKRFRREPISDKLLAVAVEAAKWLCGQDALNFICKGAIAPLDPRWNVQLGDYCLKEQIALTGDEMWIAHFTSDQKPWLLPTRRFSSCWWRYVYASDVSRLWARAWGDALVSPRVGTPKVSVIMPVYNAAKYLPEALASVLMQKELPEIELICIDDGSTDDSVAILEFWKCRDARIQVLRQTNQGPGVARNAGLDAAKGEYVCFLDADDTIASGAALQQAYSQAKSDKLDILLAGSSNMSETGNVILRDAGFVRELLPSVSVFEPDAIGAGLYILAQGAPWAKLFRRQFLDVNNLRFPPLKRTEDLPFVQLALSLARRIGVMLVPTINHRMGVATSLESTKDDTPLIFAEADRIFRGSLSRRRLMDRFRCAADVSHLVYIAYCLHMVRRFSSFRAIAQYCAEKFPELNLKGDEVGIRTFHASFKRVSSVAAAANDMNSLAEIFADVQVSKRLRSLRDSSNADLAVKSAELEHLRGVITQLKGNIEKQRKAIAAKDTALEHLRGATNQLRGNIEKQREAIAAKDAALEQLRGATTQLRDNIEKQRGAISAKDAALEQLRGATTQLRDNIEKQRGAISAKDAALEQLRGATTQLRGNIEKQRGAISAKDAALKQLRGATTQLRGNIEKQREAIAAKDSVLEQLRGVTTELKGNIEKQRGAIFAKDTALEQLRGVTTQLKGNIEKQRGAIAAKDAALEKLRGVTTQLKGNIERQRGAIAAKDAALEQLRGATAQLRGNIEKQRGAISAKDAALEQLRGATAQLRGNIEKQREAIAAKDAALEQLRGVTTQLKGNIEKQREAIDAKDAALDQLRGATTQLKGNIEKQRGAIAAKDVALERLRGVTTQLRGNMEKQREAIASKNAALDQLRAVTAQLKGNIERQRGAIAAKDAALAQLREVVKSQEKEITAKDKEMAACMSEIEALSRDVSEKQLALDNFSNILEQIKGIID